MATFTIDLLTGKSYLFNTGVSGSTGGGGGIVVFNNPNPTPNTVGGIPAGTSFSNKSVQEMWNMLLYPTQNPSLTAPNNTFSVSPSTNIRIIGDVIPTLTFTAGFSRGSISPSYGTNGFRSGLPNKYNYTGTGLPTTVNSTSLSNTQTLTNINVGIGTMTWTCSVSYDGGEQPKNSVGANFGSALPAGTTSAKSVSIMGVYPYFATTVDITTLTQQPLSAMDLTYVSINLVGEGGGNKQKFEFPDAWKPITGFQFYNTFSKEWEWLGGSRASSLSTFTKTTTVRTINGNSVNYNLYTHNGSTIGARELRIYTT